MSKEIQIDFVLCYSNQDIDIKNLINSEKCDMVFKALSSMAVLKSQNVCELIGMPVEDIFKIYGNPKDILLLAAPEKPGRKGETYYMIYVLSISKDDITKEDTIECVISRKLQEYPNTYSEMFNRLFPNSKKRNVKVTGFK